jgi:flagellar biosynthesis/type III secretory pathway M-ring protein FliF/YscJ
MNLRRAVFLSILLFILAIGLALIVLYVTPPGQRLVPSMAALGLFIVALFVFDNFIVKPYIIRYARRRAKEIQEAGQVRNRREFDDITRTLSKSKDEESKRLLQGLQELRHKTEETDK